MGNRMANVVIYVMAKQNVEAKKDEVLLGEAASIYCENSAIRARASKLRIHKFREGQESRVVLSMRTGSDGREYGRKSNYTRKDT